jgi:hypothetical protein
MAAAPSNESIEPMTTRRFPACGRPSHSTTGANTAGGDRSSATALAERKSGLVRIRKVARATAQEVSSVPAPMPALEERTQIFHTLEIPPVHELVYRFVRHLLARTVNPDAPRNLFRRPARLQLLDDVGPHSLVTNPRVAEDIFHTAERLLLGMMRQIPAAVVVAPHLSPRSSRAGDQPALCAAATFLAPAKPES